MKIVKYNSSGAFQWEKIILNVSNDINAEVTAVTHNSASNRVIVCGFYEYITGKKTITTYALDDNDGDLVWKKDFPNLNASIDEPTNIYENNSNIWIQARRTVDDTSRYLTIKYEYWDRELEPLEDTVNNFTYLKNQVILKLNPDIVSLEFVNNKQQVYDNLENVVPDTVFTTIMSLIEGEGQFTPRVIKVYKRLTANDTLSVTRQGDTIPIPAFWATLVVTTNVDPVEIMDELNDLPAIIQSANLNLSMHMESLPDDIQVEQESLVNTLVGGDDEDINYEGAYTIEQGKSIVRVGVYDTGIFWAHKDFGESGIASASVVTDGYDYPNGYAYYEDNNDDTKSWRHGTQVASIIGAISNNDFGMAGIAGGNFEGAVGNGIQLIDMEVYYDWGDPPYVTVDYDISLENILNAIVEGAIRWVPGGPVGYGLHIMNHSWGYYEFEEPEILQENIAYAFSNGCVIICSKGNNQTDAFHLPSDITDVQVISVGGSGDNGEYDEGDPNPNIGSNFGNGVDLIAPYGYDTQIMTLDNTDNTSVIYSGGFESGTSLSAAHVSGVAALLLSYYNNSDGEPHSENLAPEDVEGILQLTAEDKSTPDYDDLTGFGLLDAEASLQQIEKPHYKVQHIIHYYEHGTVPKDAEDIYLNFDEWTQLSNGLVIPYGEYLVDRYKIDETVYHTINPGAVIVADGYWKLQSMSDVLPTTFPTTVDIDFAMTTPSTTEVDVEGYFYKFKERWIDGYLVDDNVNKWIPSNIFESPLRISYTLLIYDVNATSTDENTADSSSQLLVFPNPAVDNVNISVEVSKTSKSTIAIYDITGSKVVEKTFDVTSGVNIFTLDISLLPAGIYHVTCSSIDTKYSGKFIKD